MSVCECGWGGGETLGSCILGGGPRTARTPGRKCCNCGGPVEPGQQCVDFAGLHGDDHGGFFFRMHAECYWLMIKFAGKMCGDTEEWSVPFSLAEAAAHAVTEEPSEFWMNWLEDYEKSWRLSPEPPDPNTRRVQKWVRTWQKPGALSPVPRVVAHMVWVREDVDDGR